MINIQKCAIIGCGFVGASTAFALVQNSIFSELVLIDSNSKKAEGEAMDLSHSIPFTRPLKISATSSYDDISDCAIVIVTAGASQKPDETRIDLVNKNVEIFKKIIPQIAKSNPNCILLIVSNPVDILTYVALKLSGFPPHRVIGSGTVLDTARLKYLLGEHLNIDNRSIHAFIIGEHGDSEVAVWSSANVSGVDLNNFCELCKKCNTMNVMHSIYEDVRDSAYTVIQNKGATYYAIAMTVCRIVECIVRDEHSVLPVSSLISDQYGLKGLCLSLPAIVGKIGVEKILNIPLNQEETENLILSAKKLKEVINQINFK